MEQGIEIGRRARSFYPGGTPIEEPNLNRAAELTTTAISDPDISVIYEGTFLFGEFATKADILKRKGFLRRYYQEIIAYVVFIVIVFLLLRTC